MNAYSIIPIPGPEGDIPISVELGSILSGDNFGRRNLSRGSSSPAGKSRRLRLIYTALDINIL
jgi:hypothetical protein